jgi:putative tricarboxylic transport membrane protein
MIQLISEVISNVMNPSTIVFCFTGTFMGMLFGAVPGLGATMGMTLVLPLTFKMGPVQALIMLPAIYVGAMAGDRIPVVTMGIPGTAGAAADVMDGYPLGQQGRGEEALNNSLIGSVIGGILSALAALIVSGSLARFALKFGPTEMFWLGLLGLSIVASLTGADLFKGFTAAAFGVFLSSIGLDLFTGVQRFTFGSAKLYDGVPFLVVLMGFFAIARVLLMIEGEETTAKPGKDTLGISFKDLLPKWLDIKNLIPTMLRGSTVGTILGALPGIGAVTSGWVAYYVEKSSSKHPEQFGKGAMEGLVAPETGNSACTGGAIIPLLALGIPGSASMAVLLAGFKIQGLPPGPDLFVNHIPLVYTILVGLFLANFWVLAIGIFLRPFFVRAIAFSPNNMLVPVVVVFCCIGTYALFLDVNHLYMMMIFGIIGYFFNKFGLSEAAVVLGMILGPYIETGFRQSLLLWNKPYQFFVGRYGVSIILIIFIIILQFFGYYVRKTAIRARNIS